MRCAIIIMFMLLAGTSQAMPKQIVIEMTVNGKEYKRAFWWQHVNKQKMTKANFDAVKQAYKDAAPANKTKALRKALNLLFSGNQDFNVLDKLTDDKTVTNPKIYIVN